MKLFIKLMILTVVLGGLGPMLLKQQNGGFDLSQFLPAVSEVELKDYLPNGNPVSLIDDATQAESLPLETRGFTTVYKWQDENGIWHFSDQANPNARENRVLQINPEANILSVPEAVKNEMARRNAPVNAPENNSPPTAATPPSNPLELYEKAPEMMEQAENVKQLLEGKMQQQQKVLDSL